MHSNGRKTRSKTEDLQRISKTLVLAMQFSKFQPRRLPIFWARLAGGGMDRSGAELNGPAPDLPIEQGALEAASSKQSSEGRALEGSVVPATARPKAPESFQLAGAPGSRFDVNAL